MMIAAIAAPVADPAGYVLLPLTPQAHKHELSRRVNRVATLDGGAAVSDSGYSDADMMLRMEWYAGDADAFAAVARLLRTYSRVVVSTRDGVFSAVPERCTRNTETCDAQFLVVARLSAI